MLLPALTFLVVLALVLGTYWALVLRGENREQAHLRRRLKAARAVSTPRQGLLRAARHMSNVPALDAVLKRSSMATGRLQRLVDLSGLNMTVGRLLLACGCAAGGTFLLLTRLTEFGALAFVLALGAGTLPYYFVKMRAQQRLLRFEEMFPEAIDLLARALRAGHAFTTGMAMVADELGDPVGPEFRLAYDRQNFGMPLPEALRGMGTRIPLIDARFFVTAVLTQREAGGNLAEVLENLSSVIRERFKVKRQIRVVTAHARLTGWILAALPPVAALVIAIVSPDQMKILFTDPTGLRLVFLALILQVAGTLVIKRLVNFEY